MKDYRPLLLQALDLRLHGLRMRRLCLHKHLPEADALEMHRHKFCQILCYFSGGGTLLTPSAEYQIFSGAIALLPGGMAHGFRESSGRRPLSLALDFEWEGPIEFRFSHLNQSESTGIRRAMSQLNRLKRPDCPEARLVAASAALTILDTQLRSLGILPRENRAMPAFVKKFINLAASEEGQAKSIGELAGATGYQPDYLNRRFKQITGLTLLQQRDALNLEKAKRLITQGLPMQEVAARIGHDDPNYFSRWFKRHTGMPPSHYVRRPENSAKKQHSIELSGLPSPVSGG
jgi:AraC family transcriptional activator of pobA